MPKGGGKSIVGKRFQKEATGKEGGPDAPARILCACPGRFCEMLGEFLV